MKAATELVSLGIAELGAGLASGRWSSRDLVEAHLDAIEAFDGRLGAFALVMASSARAEADASDRRRARGESLGPLDGVPVAVKDVCDMEGTPTAAGVKAWSSRIAAATAPVVTRLRASGMVVIGKTHMVELAMGGWGTNPVLGTPLNPWDPDEPRAPGGSSSGSAVAVAAGLVPVALGSDTGGSIRLPAAFTGLSSLKTTPGLIPTQGTFELTPHLDTIGFLARRVDDVMLVTEAVADAGAPLLPGLSLSGTRAPLAGLRIATIRERELPAGIDGEVCAAVAGAGETFRRLGAQVVEVPAPFDFEALLAANGRIILRDAWRLYRDHVEDPASQCDEAVRERMRMALRISEADYAEALAERARAKAAWQAWIGSWNGGLLMPCTMTPAPTLRSLAAGWSSAALLTAAGNFIDAASLALPVGFSTGGLPIGAQLMGPAWSERRLAAIGRHFQRETDWHLRLPPLTAPLRLF